MDSPNNFVGDYFVSSPGVLDNPYSTIAPPAKSPAFTLDLRLWVGRLAKDTLFRGSEPPQVFIHMYEQMDS
jgi:hypothetical protein